MLPGKYKIVFISIVTSNFEHTKENYFSFSEKYHCAFLEEGGQNLKRDRTSQRCPHLIQTETAGALPARHLLTELPVFKERFYNPNFFHLVLMKYYINHKMFQM